MSEHHHDAVEYVHKRNVRATDELLARLIHYHSVPVDDGAQIIQAVQVSEILEVTPNEPKPVLLPPPVGIEITLIDGSKARVSEKMIEQAWETLATTFKGPSIALIQSVYCRRYGVSKADMIGHRRQAAIVKHRMLAVYLCRVLTERSFPDIGRKFGGRDHTTVLHSVKRIEQKMATNPIFAEEVANTKTIIMEVYHEMLASRENRSGQSIVTDDEAEISAPDGIAGSIEIAAHQADAERKHH